jgi:hypothetical protein
LKKPRLVNTQKFTRRKQLLLRSNSAKINIKQPGKVGASR